MLTTGHLSVKSEEDTTAEMWIILKIPQIMQHVQPTSDVVTDNTEM
jgi:hypothetical protein